MASEVQFPAAGATLANAGTSENAEAWVNPSNVVADDGSEAVITAATYDSPDISQLLVASDFGFSIPAGSTIDGIIVEIERRNSAGAASDNRVQLATGTTFATLVGDNKADLPTDWPTTAAIATYGSSTDTWNAGLTRDQIVATGFAVMLSVQADAANTDIQVDFIRVTVHYTPPAPQTITLTTSITSAEAVGTPTLVLAPRPVLPTAVDTAEAFGTPVLLAGAVSIIVTAIDTAESVGTPTLKATNTIAPSSIAGAEAVGNPTLLVGNVNILPSSVGSNEVVSNPTLLAGNVNIIIGAINSEEVVPNPTLLPGNVNIIIGGIGSDEFVGTPTLVAASGGSSVGPNAIDSNELFGLPTLIAGAVTIVVESAAPAEALGFPTLIVTPLPTAGNWGKVNRTPTWSTTKSRGWNEARDSLVKTRRNEGNK